MPDVTSLPGRWSPARIARLGFLLGQGWDARRIAQDSLIRSTPANVRRQAQRLGLAFNGAAPRLPHPVLDQFDHAAAKRRISREGLMRSLLVAPARTPPSSTQSWMAAPHDS